MTDLSPQPENQPRPGPALSATSDVPEAQQAAAALSEEVKPETPKLDKPAKTADKSATEAEDASGDVEEADGGDAHNPDLTPPAVKREITKERNRRRAAEAETSRTKADLSKALEALAKTTGEPVKSATAVEAEEARPSRDTFTDPDAYDTALIEWSARQSAKDTETRLKREAADQANKDRLAASILTFEGRKAAFEEDHPDFEEVVYRDDLLITQAMTSVILNDEDGPAIAYYLAQPEHRAEFDRIRTLDVFAQTAALGRIAAKLGDAPPAPVPKPKPAPIRPVGGRSTASEKSPDQMTGDEYFAYRQSQARAARQTARG